MGQSTETKKERGGTGRGAAESKGGEEAGKQGEDRQAEATGIGCMMINVKNSPEMTQESL